MTTSGVPLVGFLVVHIPCRDVAYEGPLAHLASQLMDDQPVRMFNTYSMGNKEATTLPLRWHSDYGVFPGGSSCDNGLVMWLPVLEPAVYEANGMVLAKGSHHVHRQLVQNGTWSQYQASVSGQLQVLDLYMRLGRTSEIIKPVLHPGDVLVFDKCLVHSSSGVNTLGRRRYAWQARFMTSPQVFKRGMYQSYPEMGDKHGGGAEVREVGSASRIQGVKYPLLFPATLELEDRERAAGHVFLTKLEWLRLMISYPDHLLSTNFVRVTERLGLDLNGPLLKSIVKVTESIGII
jgi:hypothetical protein